MAPRSPSGRFVLRLSPELHQRLRRLAAERGQSLNSLCAQVLDAATEGRPASGEADVSERAQWLAVTERFARERGHELVGVVCFGSYSRGELRASSDIDLLVVLGRQVPLRRRLYSEWDALTTAAAPPSRELNAHFVHLPRSVDEAGSLWLEVAVEGQVLGDPHGQVRRLMLELRRAIAAGRFVRGVAHGQPFWRRAA